MKRYPKMREVIHDGSKLPKLGTYTPPMPYLLESNVGATLGRMGGVADERERSSAARSNTRCTSSLRTARHSSCLNMVGDGMS